ncbi:zinc-dependent alcohol dehydrogenase [Lawsonibacter sp. LCP25S3_G6]|uniref:zinc-dependent alcohol dehydrogenase n=1 Tax=unclassified Lawsonibacter TaxID=2617946 RepID=UPI003F9B34D8
MMKGKAAVMTGVRQMEVMEFDVPSPGPNEVLVKIQNCNICTTDWQTWTGARKREFPWAPGHEESGIIAELGPGVTEFEVGDHVALAYAGCGYCEQCKVGNTKSCVNTVDLVRDNVPGNFAMCQYFLATVRRTFKIDPNLPFEQACYLEPLATSIHGVRKLSVKPGESLVVIGAGNLGLVNAQVARAFGCKVMVSEVNEQRCEIARSLGFEVMNPTKEDIKARTNQFTRGRGVDNVIIAVGNTPATAQAMELVRRDGRVLFFASGHPSPDLNLNVNDIHYGGYELIGTGGANLVDFELSARFLSDGVVKVEKLVSHCVPLDEAQRAFELAATPGNYRVSLVMWP